MELSKVVPAPTNYSIKREFDKSEKVQNQAICYFGNAFSKYTKVSYNILHNKFKIINLVGRRATLKRE